MPHPIHFEDDQVEVRKSIVGNFDNNCYWIACKKTGEAVLIDPANEPERIVRAAEGLQPIRALITHGHWDHVQAVGGIRRLLGIPVGIGRDDRKMIDQDPDFLIEDGDIFQIGEIALRAIHTPGHTPGSTCFHWNGLLFSGDTLFPGGPGATRGDKRAFAQIIESIRSRLFPLGDEVLVFPGHGLDTTIGAEAPSLDKWIRRGW